MPISRSMGSTTFGLLTAPSCHASQLATRWLPVSSLANAPSERCHFDGADRSAHPVFSPGDEVTIKAISAARLLLFGGEPLDGPRHVWWNFVSSSREQIERAKLDWK